MRWRVFAAWAAALLLAACATPNLADLKPGTPVDEIRAQLGQERASYPLPHGGKRLEFRGRGANTFMVDVDASGRMVQAVQVLNVSNFQNIVSGMTSEHVLMTLGKPDNVMPGGRQGGEIWSYNFQNTQCQWFQVHIGADGRASGPGTQTMLPACMQAAS